MGTELVTRARSRLRNSRSFPLNVVKPTEARCFEVLDSSATNLPAEFLFSGLAPRDPAPLAARLADQFIKQNRSVLAAVGVEVDARYDGLDVRLEVRSGTKIGAVPLRAPVSGRSEFGLVVQPRYEWSGLGAILGEMGWKIIPAPLPFSNLPRSERKVPPWVLSAIVLARIQSLLASLRRDFKIVSAVKPAPHGQVDWQEYAVRHIVRARFLDVPCRFPDLAIDRTLQGAIHFTLLRHSASLESQRSAGPFVIKLVSWCSQLLDEVRGVPPSVPTDLQMRDWMRGGLRSTSLIEGLDAIAWTVDERGLAGLCDASGLPWSMSMELFFESWVESIFLKVARHTGGVVRSGRQRETVVPINWDPPYQGSQRSLLPDLVIESSAGAVVVDAKYKDHWEDLSFNRWYEIEEAMRDRHRADLLQILAYTGTLDANRLVACLVYPCQSKTWESLNERGRLFHRASVGLGTRNVNLVLTAVPMDARSDRVVGSLANVLLEALT